MLVFSESTNPSASFGALANQVEIQLEAVRDVGALHLQRDFLFPLPRSVARYT